MLRVSRFAHFLNNDRILWNAITFSMVKEAKHLKRLIDPNNPTMKSESVWQKELGQHFAPLLTGSFLTTDEQEGHLLQRATDKASSRKIQNLFLIMTNRCNLTCAYCLYANTRSQTLNHANQTMHMPEHIAKNAIDCFAGVVKSNSREDGYWQQITFYGGEPLLNIRSLEVAVNKAIELKRSGILWEGTNLLVNTNGVLVDDRVIHLLKRGSIEVQISIDGFHDVHDRNRYLLTKAGTEGSFDLVINALRKLTDAGVPVTPMITVTEDNLPTLYQFVVWLCQEFGIRSYGMNLLMSGTGVVSEGYPKRAAMAMLETHQATLEYGAVDYPIQDQIERLFGPKIAKQECGAGRKLTVFPDGSLHTCQALEATGLTSIGELPIFKPTEPNWYDWSKRTRFQNPTCLKCPVLGSCGGGCAAGAFHTSGDINEVDPNKCNWTKSLFDLHISTCVS